MASSSGKYTDFTNNTVSRCQLVDVLVSEVRKGPIVRITPEELHIKDSEYYDEIYAPATKKRDKWTGAVSSSGTPGSIFATVGHNLHRMRRSALNPFFSKRSITSNEPQIREIVEHMCHRLTESAKTGDVIRMDAVFIAL